MSQQEAADPHLRAQAAGAFAFIALVVAPPGSLLAGVAVDGWAAGRGWSAPPIQLLWIRRAVSGRAAPQWFAGIIPAYHAPASALRVWIVAALAYALALALMGALLRLAGFPWGDSGLASKAVIAGILGPSHLRAVRKNVRPDLYGPRARRQAIPAESPTKEKRR
jgi:hypothetical protein